MKENAYLDIIKNTLTDSSFIGDDCAFLTSDYVGNSGIYVTQDSLVEDVHFSLKTISPYQLGYKSMQVNFSDLAAVCAKPMCVTVSLSLPKNIKNNFVEDFYIGVNDACLEVGVKVIGGDLTGSDKVYVSVTAIGQKIIQCDISRSYAKEGDTVLVSDCHGNSAGGLRLLQSGKSMPVSLIKAHLSPKAETEKSKKIAMAVQSSNSNFAMMDSSDGLGDALFKIAQASNVRIDVDFSKVPVSKDLITEFPNEYKDFVFWGGEDYKLVCCVNEEVSKELVHQGFWKIGAVSKSCDKPLVVINNVVNNKKEIIDVEVFSHKSFDHFGE